RGPPGRGLRLDRRAGLRWEEPPSPPAPLARASSRLAGIAQRNARCNRRSAASPGANREPAATPSRSAARSGAADPAVARTRGLSPYDGADACASACASASASRATAGSSRADVQTASLVQDHPLATRLSEAGWAHFLRLLSDTAAGAG